MSLLLQYNYGGIGAREDETTDVESQVDVVSNWNIAEYLPKKIQVSLLLEPCKEILCIIYSK